MVVSDRTPIAEAFEKGLLADNVQLGPDGASLILYDLTLVEDDGPGACGVFEHGPASPTTIHANVRLKKVLHLDRAGARRAHLALLAAPRPGETAPLRVVFNGRAFTCKPGTTAGDGLGWPAIRVPATLLREGDNEVVLSCAGERGWRAPLARREDIIRNDPARRERPPRSFQSTDGGKTWATGLGDRGDLRGEWMVRLHLDQYAPRGELIGPVIDLAALAAGGELPTETVVAWLQVRARKKAPPGTRVKLFVRSGDAPVYDPATWGDWRPCGRAGRVPGETARFVQWRAVLTTTRPRVTPALEAVELWAEVEPQRRDWAGRVALTDSHSEEIRFTSIPFEYERFDEPGLVELRRRYQLDQVVSGAQTELEKMIKLRNWVSAQWEYDPPIPHYPAWDAREILQLRKGFCVQYAIVYMQCALSLGMQTRFVFGWFPNTWVSGKWICGHEVNEYWSNELGKWVMMDAHQDECFVDRATGAPLSMLELHEDQLNTYAPDGIIAGARRFDDELPSEGILRWKGAAPAPDPELPKLPPKWGCLHWVPRNNFFARRFPEPLYQGRNWTWTGYWLWQDDRTPRQWHLGRYTRRRSDIEWTLNQVRWAAALGKQEGTIQLTLGTVTPDFDSFLTRVDDGDWQPTTERFQWRLHPGRNRLELRVRNRAGVLGRPSWLEVEYR